MNSFLWIGVLPPPPRSSSLILCYQLFMLSLMAQ